MSGLHETKCVVIGAGVIGLAVARALAEGGRHVVILERERRFGTGISSRSSEVIHAGIYYAAGSLKALTCVAGRESLYRHCAAHDVAHRRCGKLIVASSAAQLPRLEAIRAQAGRNGVELEWLDRGALGRMEPGLVGHAALFSPATGIVDVQGYMSSLLAGAEARGAVIAYGTPVRAIRPHAGGFDVALEAGESLRCRMLVNAAGLGARDVAAAVDGFPAALIPPLHYAKGSYFALSGAAPFRHLIYPLPEAGGLGIHMTLDLAGRARFGPDVEWVEAVDYCVDPERAPRFYAAIRRYWPGLGDGQLTPAYAGIRPKLTGAGEAEGDFRLCGPALHGMAGLVHLFGIESPGVTASLALAERVVAAMEECA